MNQNPRKRQQSNQYTEKVQLRKDWDLQRDIQMQSQKLDKMLESELDSDLNQLDQQNNDNITQAQSKIAQVIRDSNVIKLKNLTTKFYSMKLNIRYRGLLKNILAETYSTLQQQYQAYSNDQFKQIIDLRSDLYDVTKRYTQFQTVVSNNELEQMKKNNYIEQLEGQLHDIKDSVQMQNMEIKKLRQKNQIDDLEKLESIIEQKQQEINKLNRNIGQFQDELNQVEKKNQTQMSNQRQIFQRQLKQLEEEKENEKRQIIQDMTDTFQYLADGNNNNSIDSNINTNINTNSNRKDEILDTDVSKTKNSVAFSNSVLEKNLGLKRSKEIPNKLMDKLSLFKLTQDLSQLNTLRKNEKNLNATIENLKLNIVKLVKQFEEQTETFNKSHQWSSRPENLNNFLLYPKNVRVCVRSVDISKTESPSFDLSFLNTFTEEQLIATELWPLQKIKNSKNYDNQQQDDSVNKFQLRPSFRQKNIKNLLEIEQQSYKFNRLRIKSNISPEIVKKQILPTTKRI